MHGVEAREAVTMEEEVGLIVNTAYSEDPEFICGSSYTHDADGW